MRRTETKIASSINLEEPPNRGSLSVVTDLSEEAHYLRVTLDKSENFKVVVGKKLNELLEVHFGGERNRLRDWYEAEVVEGKAHRAWTTVEKYLGIVRTYGELAAARIAQAEEDKRIYDRDYREKTRTVLPRERTFAPNGNNDLEPRTATVTRTQRSEYELRAVWLGEMNYLWFKGKPEWQQKWLEDRKLHKDADWS